MYRLLLSFLCAVSSIPAIAQIDSALGITAPKEVTRDHKQLTGSLCDGLVDERDKANAIYNWITHNIKYDIKTFENGSFKSVKPDQVLKSRLAVCDGYAVLFTAMCREAGLKAVNVEGYAKDWMFDNGDKLYIPRHEWVAVQVNGEWQLADPTWGAGVLVQSPNWLQQLMHKVQHKKLSYAKRLEFKFKYDPQYFLQDPETFRLKHLPSDPLWQLTDTVMPMAIFESGDSAITRFNTLYSNLRQVNPELDRIADLGEDQKTFEMADRAYAYNNRFPVVLAIKNTYRAASEVQQALTDSTITTGGMMVADAKTALKKSEDYIKDQKKVMPDQYNMLKKKNKAKNQEAKQDISKIKADDKRLIGEADKYAKAADSKAAKIKKKYAAAQDRKKGMSTGKIEDIETGKVQKKETAPEYVAMKDSIAARKNKFVKLEEQIIVRKSRISDRQLENSRRLDSLATSISEADSVLMLEAIARLHMQDNYDDEVIMYNKLFKQHKYHTTDTLQKYYLVTFDTIANMEEDLQKLQVQQMDLQKTNIRNLEQLKKWNNSDPELANTYKESVEAYFESIDGYNSDLLEYTAYLKGNKKLFANLVKVNKKQLEIAGYMEKAEDMRKGLEERAINKKKAFDLKENEQQKTAVKKLYKKVDEISVQ